MAIISAISLANPVQITTTGAHVLTTGMQVIITGSNSSPSIDGTWTVTVIDTTNFTIPTTVNIVGTTGWARRVLYVDIENGSNANNGTTFALRVQDLTTGLTAARTEPGDFIKIMKSPSPTLVGTATWNQNSPIVTLDTAVNATIDNGEVLWTASTNVTTNNSSSNAKEGTYAGAVSIQAAFSTGKAAYKQITQIDLSAYQQISFWISMGGSSVALSAGQLQFKLCSDTTGDTPVDTFDVPAIAALSAWYPFTVNKGSPLGSAIQSIALYVTSNISDSVTETIYFDNIIACKAPSANDSLSLVSMISKNPNENCNTNDEAWYPIQSINGATIYIDCGNNCKPAETRGYEGITENVALYKRETVKTAQQTSSSGSVLTCNESGTSAEPMTFSGGWNTTDMSTQTGVTFMDGVNGVGYGLNAVSNHHNFEYIWNTRYANMSWTSVKCNTFHCAATGMSSYVNISAVGQSNIDLDFASNCYSSYGNLYLSSYYSGNKLTARRICNSANSTTSTGMYITAGTAIVDKIWNNKTYGASLYGNSILKNATFQNNSTGGVSFISQDVTVLNCKFQNQTSPIMVPSNGAISKCYSFDHNGQKDNTFIQAAYFSVVSDTAISHAPNGTSWEIAITSSLNITKEYPAFFRVARVAVRPDTEVIARLWCRRDNLGLNLGLRCVGGQIFGPDNTIQTLMTGAINQWEEVSISFIPTRAAVLEFEAFTYGGNTYTGWVDDFSITQL